MSASTPFMVSPLAPVMAVLRKDGILAPTDGALAQALGIIPAALATQYPSRETLLLRSLPDDLEHQKPDHVHIYPQYPRL